MKQVLGVAASVPSRQNLWMFFSVLPCGSKDLRRRCERDVRVCVWWDGGVQGGAVWDNTYDLSRLLDKKHHIGKYEA